MAEKRTINIDINSNASEAEKDFKSFNKAVDETTKSAKNLDATFEEVYGELQPLTTRMGEAEDRLYELALAGKTTSKEYQELLTKVGEYRKVQIQTDLAVDGAATTITQKLGSALNGATSGFAATQGAMALFGDENQALEESLLKVQSALAIQQGVQGLTEAYRELSIGSKIAAAGQAAFTFVTGGATTGLKLFRAALISTGVGALVVGLGLLIANFDKVKEVLTDVNKGFKEGGLLTKALMIAFMPLIATVKLVQKGLQAIGVLESDEEKERKERAAEQRKRFEAEKKEREEIIKLLQEEREELQKQNELQQRYSNARILALQTQKKLAKGNAEEISEIEKKISSEKIAQLRKDQQAHIADQVKALGIMEQLVADNAAAELEIQKGLAVAGKEFYKRKENSEKAYYKLKEQVRTNDFQALLEIDNQIADIQADETIREKDELKKRQDNYKNYAAERLRIARQIEDIENSLLTDGIEKELEINRDKFRRLREDAKKNTKLTTKERATLIDLRNQEEAQAEAKIIADNQKRREDAFKTERSDRVELLNFVDELNTAEVESEKAKNLAIIESSKDKAAKQKEIDEKAKADAQAIQDFKFDIASQGLQTISNLTELFAGKSEKAAKKAFQIQKAVSIAQATIDTYKSANAIFASTAANPITVLNPSAPFIAAGVAVAAGLVNVATIASQKFQGGGSTGGGGQESAPDLGGGAAPSFNVVGDSGINQIAQLQQQPVQAFVVSGEVTTSQALDRNRVQNATL